MNCQYLIFLLDTNCINARQNNCAMNQLEIWHDHGLIHLCYTDVAHAEASYKSDARAAKAAEFSWVGTNKWGENEDVRHAVSEIMFPCGAKDKTQINDARIVYEAERFQWPLITMDGKSKRQPGGILGHAKELLAFGIEVLTPESAVEKVLVSVPAAQGLRLELARLSENACQR